ncbi:MAG TPA: DinB family protein, partial [Fimbriimonadaceae bacterium]|nr:DinB family protein [Fimbriimonadaceae bacterium]
SAFDYTYEVVIVNRRTAKRLRGEDPGPFANDGWITAPVAFCEKAVAQSEFQSTAEEFIAALEIIPDDELERVIPLPKGETSPLDLASLNIGHWTYHDGQLNYTQAISGDDKVHWE